MKTLKQKRYEIEKMRAEYRRLSSLNNGVIRGAIDLTDLQRAISGAIEDYNRISRRDQFVVGILTRRN